MNPTKWTRQKEFCLLFERLNMTLTEQQEEEIGNKIAKILQMKKQTGKIVPGWQLTTGWKTGKGLFRQLQGMIDEANETGDVKE